MKTLMLIPVLLLSGCFASVEYDPKTEKVKYTRMGNQKLEDVKIVTANGTQVQIGNQESETIVGEAVRAAVEAALRK